MKLEIALLSALIITGCSKNNPEAPLPVSVIAEESNQSLVTERTKKAKNEYTKSLKAFTDSKDNKLSKRDFLFKDFIEKANLYKALLSNTQSNQELQNLNTEITKQEFQHELILTDIEKLNDSKESLEEVNTALKLISANTDGFILTKITEQDLRASLLENVSIYKNTSRFLLLSFKNEFTDNEILDLESKISELNSIEQVFAPLMVFKEVLNQSEINLGKVDFSFQTDDHTTAALTHEESFFKALEGHISSIETFKSDASIFLNRKENEVLNESISKIIKTLSSLKEIRDTQEAIVSDLKRIENLGYIFPKNIKDMPEDKLKWQEKEVYIFTGPLPKRIKWEIGFHRVNPLFNNNYPLEDITKYKLFERVNKKTYGAFDDAFGTAFSRLIVYRTTYDRLIPKHLDEKYFKIGLLVGLTYQEVDDYIETIPF
jgi:hypothetical protein